MDNYPEALAPVMNEGGGVEEPFQAWWDRVGREGFPTVPRNVARHWLHRHWNHSPWSHIESRKVSFRLECWPSSELLERVIPGTGLNCDVARGEWLIEYLLGLKRSASVYRPGKATLARIMVRRREWPSPIIIADQRQTRFIRSFGDFVDVDLLLIEGHDRFAMAQALKAWGTIKPKLPVWVMSPL